MNYFIDSPDWIDLVLDKDLYNEITRHHHILSKPLDRPGIDGFYFIDPNDYAILVDSRNLQVMTYKVTENEQIVYNNKISYFDTHDERVYYHNKIIIKNGKKFYKIVSKKRSKILDWLFCNKYSKKLIFYCF